MQRNNDGRPVDYTYQKNTNTGVTIRPVTSREPRTLSKNDSDRIREAARQVGKKSTNKR